MPTIPLTTPVRVQVQAATGNCWEAVYGTSIRNDVEQFKAKSN